MEARQHCRLSICGYFGWLWQILKLRWAGLSSWCYWTIWATKQHWPLSSIESQTDQLIRNFKRELQAWGEHQENWTLHQFLARMQPFFTPKFFGPCRIQLDCQYLLLLRNWNSHSPLIRLSMNPDKILKITWFFPWILKVLSMHAWNLLESLGFYGKVEALHILLHILDLG